MADKLLDVQDLNISFGRGASAVHVVRGVSFSVGREKVGIVGESGSGKSMTGRALIKLSPKRAIVRAKKLSLCGADILRTPESQMLKIRGRKASMILQDPSYSLNPLMRVGAQVMEAYLIHHSVSRGVAKQRTLEMLESVQIRDPEKVFNLFPHEVSGGMGQRVMIAMMLIPEPDLIIADEPTSALDATVQQQVLQILDELIVNRNAGLIFISHDLNLVAKFCDRVLVMYAGRIVEEVRGDALHKARHPYTRALLASLPRLDTPVDMLEVPQRSPDWLNGPVYRMEEPK